MRKRRKDTDYCKQRRRSRPAKKQKKEEILSPPVALGPLLDQKLTVYELSACDDSDHEEETKDRKELHQLDEQDVVSLLDRLHGQQQQQQQQSEVPTFEENPTWLLERREKKIALFLQLVHGAKLDPERRIEAVEWIQDCCAEEKMDWTVFSRACAYYEFLSLAASQCTCARHMQDHKPCILGVEAKPSTIMFACICVAYSNKSDAESDKLYPKFYLNRRGSDSFAVFSVTINALIVWLFKHDLLLVPTLCDWLQALYSSEALAEVTDEVQCILRQEYHTYGYRPYSLHSKQIAKEIGLK